ncbi:MAG: UDP-N-acetyl-alpha-D-muramoyl-L-alanyl-L-glutamat e epimerase [Wenzhouxiangellaceae bacterium]
MNAAAAAFHFVGHDYAPDSGVLRLRYRLEPGPELVEELIFPPPPAGVEPPPADALTAACDMLLWIAGVSYWKTSCAPRMICHHAAPDAWQAAFLQRLYWHGLGEFAHENRLDLSDRIHFPDNGHTRIAPDWQPTGGALVPLGGGKDSLVVVEKVRRLGIAATLTAVGQAPLINEVAAATGLPLLRVQRRLAPELKALNEAGAWNGHVPITAINSAILSVLALLHGHRWLIFANERSADSPTRLHGDGGGVNHQYSKSLAFEDDWRHFLQRYVGGLDYFSLLRPWRELAVCRDFAALPQYHPVFSSCNRHFHLEGARTNRRWCGHCPKCHFVFLALAPFLPPDRLVEIFGVNLLDQPELLPDYRALLDLHGDRPFECIGEVAECRSALQAISHQPEWTASRLVPQLAAELPQPTPDLESLLQPQPPHRIPAQFAADLPSSC